MYVFVVLISNPLFKLVCAFIFQQVNETLSRETDLGCLSNHDGDAKDDA